MSITYRETGEVDFAQALALYRALRWSSAEKPRELERALRGSHSLVTAWDYRKCGFERAGHTEPMWVYAGTEH